MIQDELWLIEWQETIDFLQTNRLKPSKFIPADHNYNGPLKLDTRLRQIKTLNFVVEYGKDITHKVHA